MSIKISNLSAITSGQLISSNTAILPIVSDTTGSLITYQTSVANIKTYVRTGNLDVTGCVTAGTDSLFYSNLTILGNLIVQGNTSVIGSNNIATTDNILELHLANTANIAQGWTFDDGKDIGIRFHYYNGTNLDAALVFSHSSRNLEWFNAGAEGNATFTGTSYGTFKTGSIFLTNNTPTTANSTGALIVSGGVSSGGNIWSGGNIDAQGYVSAVGSGTFSSVRSNAAATVGSNLTVTVLTTTNALSVNTVATIGSTLIVAANATVNALTVNGSSVIGTTLQAQGGLQATPIGNATASSGQFTTVSATGNVTGSALTSNASITAVTTLSALGGIQDTPIGNVTPSTAQFSTLTTSANATVANLTVNSSVTVGTTLDVTSNLRVGGDLVVIGTSQLSGNVNTNNIMPFGNANANIGSESLQFNTVFAKATSAQYADLAENYRPDADYEKGTVVIFGGSEEITVTSKWADNRVAGVISTDPAYLMNSGDKGLPVALRGKVPIKVVGKVGKGDLLVTSTTPGYAESVSFRVDYHPCAVVAKSLETSNSYIPRTIMAVVV